MVAGFQGLHEWPVNHYVYYIYYLIKFFSMQGIAPVLKTDDKVIASPYPNLCIG